MRVERGWIAFPVGTDIVTFGRLDGKPATAGPVLPEAPRRTVTLGHLRDRYLATHANGTVEANRLYTNSIHLAHVCRLLGEGCPVGELTVARLQEYVNERARKVSPTTIRKELATLRAAWSWGGPMTLTECHLPLKGLRFPKADQKPNYMTREEIERRVRAGDDADTLWESLYLTSDDVADLLTQVRSATGPAWLYP